ncbi:hypothetical protein A2276_00995 [candidate division WOR-1 bacterium RIFOXYA12_FULL_43_27]|uniref:Pseudouridine synthase n=1 Tax=candidate division WOR-1 bacterium RIFOXYC2_FULL_46_14 TaxID=1802587 RepID=A0A1F4U4S2_UNCSA|nr:MAG: hypothetical protein A2276_00995 [candidate division WOR-1 bacterium RIFOXYA12_FULL_43_27]OGC20738.1 MAG: hypothetical protein A2292_06880 [candidate division WOR-1 bacterium RIFOXYB2_FULL_46_45]OGC31525.1 MAG: hypothetical protein A2232_04570 [candidate division WOR-1 bacterium RIFOXYA2_FULL_46_56]OGC39932.1 MAG: hypothetical protein A2438_05410 [candidate division WOR-1 bacterium RIFOXYC2_FULL_46_14]
MIRLQKYIADCGIASRRRAEELIVNSKVEVNGRTIRELGTKIDPEKDKVWVLGKAIKLSEKKVYIMLNKPKGYETTAAKKNKTIFDLVKTKERIFPVGRLDKDSSGLLILTNDGEYANQMMHPRYEHEKEYLVDIARPLSLAEIERLRRGVVILGKKTSPAKIKTLSPRRILITIHEGMNRQIRRMLEAVDNEVINLKRVRIGEVKLLNLASGEWKEFIPTTALRR